MVRGDHIYVAGTLHGIPFQHHGIDMGDGTVIHLAPVSGMRVVLRDATDRFAVRRDPLETFAMGRSAKVVRHEKGLDLEQVARQAESYIGKTGYSLLEGNCEHFAALCATGASRSQQIEMAEATVSAMASMATKAVWAVSSRIGASLLIRGATKIHPAMLIADGVEVAALAIGCQRGLTAEKSRQVARISGSLAAVGIGGVLGGPAGVAISLAAHSSSTALAERLCKSVRRVLS